MKESLTAAETVESMAAGECGGFRRRKLGKSFLQEGEGKATVLVCKSNSFMSGFSFIIIYLFFRASYVILMPIYIIKNIYSVLIKSTTYVFYLTD